MTWQDALELEVARSGHHRYRELCADGHPDHEAWRARLLARAGGAPVPPPVQPRSAPIPPSPPLIPVAESIRLTKAMKACPYRNTVGCGCAGAWCGLRPRGKQLVSHLDCFECIKRYS